MEHKEENWVPIRVPITKSMTWVSFVHANDFTFLIEKRIGILLFPSILGNVTLIAYRTCTRLKQIVLLVHIVLFNYCALWVKVDLLILYRGIKMTIHSLWEYINILRRFNVVLKRQILVNTKPVCMVWKHAFSHEQYTVSLTLHLFIPRKLTDYSGSILHSLNYLSFLWVISSSLTRKQMSCSSTIHVLWCST